MSEFSKKWKQFITEEKTPLRENFEVGDKVTFKGIGGEEMTVVDKRKMFAVKDNGRDLMAILVELPDGTTSEYDETQLTAAPTIGGDRATRVDKMFQDDLNSLVDEFDDKDHPRYDDVRGDLDADYVLDSVLDEELFTPNEMGDKAVEDESNSAAFQEGKGQDLADKYVAKLRQEFKNLSDDELDEFKKTLATAFDMNESVNEGSSMRVTKQMWQKMSDDEKENSLLTVFEDPDTAEKWIGREWDSLPGSVTRDMHTESVNEDINYDEFDEKPKDFKSLLELGAKATKLMGEDKLIEISDAFEERGDEQSDRIASHLNMAIELIQDGESKSATPHLKKFNKACREALGELN